MHSYTISNEPDNKLFLRVCEAIEKSVIGLTKEKILIDVDGSLFQQYNLLQGKIVVQNDYEVYALYVDSDIDIADILELVKH